MRYALLLVILLFFSNCSKKVTVKTLSPAKNYKSEFKKIKIGEFKNDNIGLRDIIKSTLSNYSINNKKFFTIVDENKIDLILNEQKFQDSGLSKKEYSDFSFVMPDSIMTGKIIDKSYYISYYLAKITDYNKCLRYRGKTCIEYAYYYENCQVQHFNLTVSIDIDRIKDSKNLYSKTFKKYIKNDLCYHNFLTQKDTFIALSKKISNELIKDIAPSYKFFQIKLIEKIDLDNIDKDKFEFALKLIEKKQFDLAKKFLLELNQTNSSYAINYNLGLIYEVKGDYKRAKYYYNNAKTIMINKNELIDEIILANDRIDKILQKEKILKEQL